MKIELSNGRILPLTTDGSADDSAEIRGSVFIADGKIVGLGNLADFSADRVIDAQGLVIAPGLIDLSARFSAADRELRAAVAGGVTTLCCPPDTSPALDEPGLVERLKLRVAALAMTQVAPIGALTQHLGGERPADMVALARAGCVAFSQASRALPDNETLLRCLQYAATFNLPVWLQALDAVLSRGGVAHDGEVASRLGLPGIPLAAETIAVTTLLDLARLAGARLHLTRVSSAEAVRRISAARAAGQPVTCDVSIQHLHLADADIGFFDANTRLTPPLRAPEDRDALQSALARGDIDAVCSDHTPVSEDGKALPFAEAEPGASAVELLLPLTLGWARANGVSLAAALRKISTSPAAIAGLDARGLRIGGDADLCAFDPDESWTVTPTTLISRGRNSPFMGRELRGRVRYTVVGGRVAFERAEA
jgi:dihydroorotase